MAAMAGLGGMLMMHGVTARVVVSGLAPGHTTHLLSICDCTSYTITKMRSAAAMMSCHA